MLLVNSTVSHYPRQYLMWGQHSYIIYIFMSH